MTKRKVRFFRVLRFYNQDLFGRLVLKDPKRPKRLAIGFKNAKVNKLMYERLEERVDRRRKRFGGGNKFFYRIDTIKIKKRRRRLTKFAKRLRARLIIRKFASQMTVRTFRSYVKKSSKGASLFIKFLRLIESRLDVFVFRMNFFETSSQVRQSINHGFIIVSGKICKFSNRSLRFNELVSFVDKNFFRNNILNLFKKKVITRSIPAYLEINYRILTAMLIFSPKTTQVVFPTRIKPTLLVSIGKKF